MGKFGEAAIRAVNLVSQDDALSPVDAWKKAVGEFFPGSKHQRRKGCPRDAFLGLCEMGVVRGIRAGSYTTSEKNKGYAVRALAALRSDPSLVEHKTRLWAIALEGADKEENKQMDVLVTLWREGLVE